MYVMSRPPIRNCHLLGEAVTEGVEDAETESDEVAEREGVSVTDVDEDSACDTER